MCTERAALLNEFRHWGVVKRVLRATGEIVEFDVLRIDAEVAVQRGENFAEVNGPLDSFSAKSVGRSDHLAGFHAAASKQTAADARPVIPAGVFVDARRSAELAPRND